MLLAGDFIGIGPLGFSLPKPAWIARRGQGLHYGAFEVEEPQVRTYGQVAVATGREAAASTPPPSPPPSSTAPCGPLSSRPRRSLVSGHRRTTEETNRHVSRGQPMIIPARDKWASARFSAPPPTVRSRKSTPQRASR
jgi:hypothetical protein